MVVVGYVNSGVVWVELFPVVSGDNFSGMFELPRFSVGFCYVSVVPNCVCDALTAFLVDYKVCEIVGEIVKFFFCGSYCGYCAHPRLVGERMTVHPSTVQL